MGKIYTITRTQPHTYLDVGGNPISGTKVYFTVHANNEGHEVDIPNVNDTAHVDKRINEVVASLKRLRELGG